MLDDAVEYVGNEVWNQLGLADGDVIIGNVHTLAQEANSAGPYLSLVDLPEETTLGNEDCAHVTRTRSVLYQEPSVHLSSLPRIWSCAGQLPTPSGGAFGVSRPVHPPSNCRLPTPTSQRARGCQPANPLPRRTVPVS